MGESSGVKAVSGKAFGKLLESHGWALLRVQGSHHIYGKVGEAVHLSVPIHGNRPLKIGLQRHFMKLAGLSEGDL